MNRRRSSKSEKFSLRTFRHLRFNLKFQAMEKFNEIPTGEVPNGDSNRRISMLQSEYKRVESADDIREAPTGPPRLVPINRSTNSTVSTESFWECVPNCECHCKEASQFEIARIGILSRWSSRIRLESLLLFTSNTQFQFSLLALSSNSFSLLNRSLLFSRFQINPSQDSTRSLLN